MSKSVVYTDVEKLAKDLEKISELTAEEITQNIMYDLGPRIIMNAAQRAPRKTGQLANSIAFRVNGSTLEILAKAPYGNYQEFGTASRGEFGGSPYTIVPRKGKRLRFSVGGKTVYARKVTHPGIRPRPYMRPAAIEELGPLMKELLDRGQALIVKGPNSAL